MCVVCFGCCVRSVCVVCVILVLCVLRVLGIVLEVYVWCVIVYLSSVFYLSIWSICSLCVVCVSTWDICVDFYLHVDFRSAFCLLGSSHKFRHARE